MLFTSITYLFFLPLVVIGYFLLKPKWRWAWLLIASYAFYMSWKPIYALLILSSTVLDYYCAIGMAKKREKKDRKPFLYISLLGNLGMLFLFKYLGFFNELIRDISELFSLDYGVSTLSILFPIGISFYTFQSLSYTIDVYRGDREPERHFGIMALYVSFFPQLVIGPIEKSTVLLPQLRIVQKFQWFNVTEGLRLITWGVFKKIVLADKIGHYVNTVYDNPHDYHGFSYVIIGFAFTLQVLFDFGGYTDIAIGSAKLFGIDLSINFKQPFHAKNIREFWGRWHMSMTQWFYEYLFKPISRKFRKGWRLNILILMLVIGFWHGPSWGFLIFGLIHGIYYIVSEELPVFENKNNRFLDTLLKGIAMCGVFILVSISTYFFRAETIGDAIYAFTEGVKGFVSFNYSVEELGIHRADAIIICLNLFVYFIIQNLPNHNPKNPFSSIRYRWIRWGIYYYLLLMIFSLAHTKMQEFIYFHL